MAKKKKAAVVRIVYLVLLFLFGMLLFLFWESRQTNLTKASIDFDNALTDTLVDTGITNSNIVSQSRQEKDEKGYLWIEYYREIRPDPSLSPDEIVGAVERMAKKRGLVVRQFPDEKELTVEVTRRGHVLSRLVILKPEKKADGVKKKIALVIDDAGFTKDLSGFLDLGIPITFAILPHETYSSATARTLSGRRMPFMLHLPLEPERYPAINPGKTALLVSMNDQTLRKEFLDNLESVPGVCGVSNHMGSRFSQDEHRMEVLMRLVKEKGLFYFDSYTTPKTKARLAARAVGLPFMENGIFIDIQDDHEYMKKQCVLLLKKALKHGSAVAIGHVQKKNILPVLREMLPQFEAADVEFVYLTDLMPRPLHIARK